MAFNVHVIDYPSGDVLIDSIPSSLADISIPNAKALVLGIKYQIREYIYDLDNDRLILVVIRNDDPLARM